MIDQPVDDLMQEFLAEATGQLDALMGERNRLRKEPKNAELLKGLLELVHTTKGACGFLPFPRLEAVASVSAVLVDDIYEGKIEPSPGVMMLILGVLDRFRDLLDAIKESGAEPSGDDAVLIRGLEGITGGEGEYELPEELASTLVSRDALVWPTEEHDLQQPPSMPKPEAETIVSGQLPMVEPGTAFVLFRLGDAFRAIDLFHVEWLDLIASLSSGGRPGEVAIQSKGWTINLAPYDDAVSRNPSGPWPLIVLGDDERRIGLIVDEIMDVVGGIEPGDASGRLRMAAGDDVEVVKLGSMLSD